MKVHKPRNKIHPYDNLRTVHTEITDLWPADVPIFERRAFVRIGTNNMYLYPHSDEKVQIINVLVCTTL